jgi:hypothetical protein
MDKFLTDFGLKQEAEALTIKTQAATSGVGSQAWYLVQANRGQQLFEAGRVTEAAEIFRAMIEKL